MGSTCADIADGGKLVVTEKLMTHGKQYAETTFEVELDGEGSSANVISRSVAKDDSKQIFLAKINGNNRCAGHSECDAIIMDNAKISAIPEINANHLDAELIHEAAIGKIAGDQIIKLMTLGLSEAEAEAQIINGFLK
ncbi:MAG: SufD family Fe-S cluster assembly protein [Clostridia bacterium]|nr:SufD family Fe-S cluster assembly protein [Clostridia bacterium]